jgi:hypothetical protein
MKQLLFLFLFLLPCLAWAQYPSNGNQKITLGEQSTADGLVYRGLAADTNVITPFSDTSAYIILDTVNNRFFHYKINTNVWSVAGGGDTTSIAYVNTYGAQTVNGAKTLTSNLILKNSQEPSRAAIVTTQGFAADTTNWTRGTGWTFNGTQAVATAATGDLTYTPSLTVTSGNAYEITYTLTGYTAGTLTVAFGNVSLALPTQNATANVILLLPTIATGGFRFTTSSFTGNLDDITVVQISNPAPVLFAGQDDGSATLYSSLRMPNSTTFAFGGGAIYTTGSNNAAIGVNALRANTTGSNNVANGQSALQNNTKGISNVANGVSALRANTTGSNNVANGAGALLNNTTGDGNVANGQSALQNNTTGSENIANGVNALLNNTTGNLNVANGSSALRNNTTGSKNVANGVSALRGNTTGSNNIATGESALYNPSESLTGSDNIAIGAFAADNIRSTATRNVVIGSYLDLPVQDGSYQGVYQNALFITGASGTGTTIAGNVGIAVNTPTARLHLVAGTATASTAPLKFTSGVNLTTAEAGSMEFNGTNLFFSPSTTRHTVNHGLTGSATLNFPSTTTLLSADLTITVTGAADGDVVSLGVPNGAVNANTCYTAWVSTANTVTVRFNNYSSGTVDPASALFKVFVTK